MGTDYGEKERAFIASLAVDTGRNLEAWMSAISEKNLTHRNDIIDWLRRQGFTFAKASWLERIHHNGGRLIYAEDGAGRPQAHVRRLRRHQPQRPPEDIPQPSHPIDSQAEPAAVDTQPTKPTAEIDDLLAKAKAYRPLAQFLIREIKTAVPEATFEARPPLVVVTHSREFAAIAVSPKDLRLCLDLGNRPFNPSIQKTRLQSPLVRVPPALTHMFVLTDARQVTADLVASIKAAAYPGTAPATTNH